MYHWIEGVPNWAALGYPYLNNDASFIDVYEPDNFRSDLNPAINFGSIQHRGFHKVPNGKRNDITSWSNCDEDWVRIQVPHNGFIASIYTTGVPNGQDVDTELYLYHDNGTLIASHDNKSANNLYSEILDVMLDKNTYWIKVVNKGNTDGEYLLHLERCGIECCYNDLATNVSHISAQTGDYYLGVRGAGTTLSQEYFGESLLVQGATLGLNTNSSNIAWFTFDPPQINSHYKISFCNQAELTIQSGTLEIGDPTNGRTAEVRFTEGTKLDVDGSSQIIVKNGSKLIIEAGAELSLAAGAQIILAGSDAVLEIEGTLQLGTNQYFSIGTQSSQTPGYIRFLPGAQVLAGSGAQMVLGEVNNLRKVLELAENAQISLPAGLAKFEINYGEVYMAPGSRLMVDAKTILLKAHIERLGSTGFHHGLLLSGNHLHDIKLSHFKHATTGLEMNLNGNLHQPVLLLNHFSDNQKGLLVHGGSVFVGSGSFTNNSSLALDLSALSAATTVNNVDFSNNANGIKISSPNSHPISIQNCSLDRSYISGLGIQILHGNVMLRNNVISNYQDAIEAWHMSSRVRLACNTISNASNALNTINFALLDLSNQARNVIEHNDYAIYTDNGLVFMNNGYNDFSNNNNHPIYGLLAPNCYQESVVNTTTGSLNFYELAADQNRFESNYYYPNTATPTTTSDVECHYHSGCLSDFLMYVDEEATLPVYRKNSNPSMSFVSCSEAAPPWWQDVYNAVNLEADPTPWVVVSPQFPGVELKQAIRTALNEITIDMDYPQNDSLALEMFKQILTASYLNFDGNGLEILATANQAMSFALSNAYMLGILPVNYGTEPEPLNDKVLVLLASLDDLINEMDDPALKAKYALEKVLILRMAGHYDTALDVLENSEAALHANYAYWNCILSAEWNYFQEIIDASQFAAATENCMEQFQARRQRYRIKHATVSAPEQRSALLIIPNPAQGSSLFRFTTAQEPALLHIFDTQGRLIMSKKIAAFTNEIAVDAYALPAGIYFAELRYANQKAERAKWVVNK
jgi:hypothetical protein